ncbi:trypsin-like peptidase domain-containing protein [Chloroflexota bacterium]
MANKVIIGILVFLAILYSGLGYYAYTLNQQVALLRGQLNAFQIEQENRAENLSGELITLREEALASIGRLESSLGESYAQIDTLDKEADESSAKLESLEERTDEILGGIEALEDEIASVANFSLPVLDATQVYAKASQATVRIGNGDGGVVGSGFIYDHEVHVVTAYHVIEPLSEIYVILPDGRTSTATTIGSCVYSDVAVLVLDDKLEVEPVTMANSARIQIGEPVAAVGSPFDLEKTITTGIVSQVNRQAEIEYDAQTRWVSNLIQFDAAINYGNSGCPLLNSAGEVIGLVIARIEPGEGDGIYYAVSSNKVQRVVTSLITKGFFDYPWLGIAISNLTPQMVETLFLDTANGVLVKEVQAGGPTTLAGIKVDDIIITIDGFTIRNMADLTSYLGEYLSPGETVTIALIRDGTRIDLPLEVGKRT